MEEAAIDRMDDENVMRIEFDPLPAEKIREADRPLVLNVSKIMLSLRWPLRSRGWKIEEDGDHYNVIVRWPSDTYFTLQHLLRVELANDVFVREVRVQPANDEVLLIAKVNASNAPVYVTTLELRIFERQTESRKRRRVDDSE